MAQLIEQFFHERAVALANGYWQGECHFTPASTNSVGHKYRDQRFVKPRDHYVLEGGFHPAVCDACSDAQAAFLAEIPRI